jgi:2',3'-cyclic-nucleotide 2'-phosphodiesterase (5'-nucleotidase family)
VTARSRRPLRIALFALALPALYLGALAFLPPSGPGNAAAAAVAKKGKARPAVRKAPAVPPAKPKSVTISILHTTDLHGHLLSWDYETAKPVDDYGLARVATLIRRVREEPNVNTILVDAGDCIQGSPLADLHAEGGPEHKREGDGLPDPQMACMNALAYDAFTVGNHEYNFGLTVLERARSEAKFPWLSANTMKTSPQGAGAYQAYLVKEVEGVRIGILGLTTPGIPTWDDPPHYAGLEFDDPLETAKHFVPILRGMERCDAVVLVCHMGLEENDQGKVSPGQAPNENRVLAIARSVPGIDAIVMGHTHVLIPSRTENGVLLTEAGRWGQALGRLDLTFEKAGPGWTLSDKRANLLKVDKSVPEDPAIVAIAQPYHDRAEAYLKTEIATAAVPLSGADGRLRDNALLDLVHKTQLEAGKADVSLAPMFNTRVAIAAGPITVRDAFALYPYENTLAVLEVTGKDLKAALEHAAEYYTGYDFGKSNAPLVNSAIPGYNFDIAQGVGYTLDLMQPVGQRIRNLSWHGKPLDEDKKLKVAVSNYRVNGGGGYDMFKGKPVVSRSEQPTRDLLIDELRKVKTVTNASDGNWRLVPSWLGEPAGARAGLELLVRRGIVPADSALAWGPSAPLTRTRYAAWLEKTGGPEARALLFPKLERGKGTAVNPGAPVDRGLARGTAIAVLPAAARVRLAGGQVDGTGPGITVGEGANVFADVFYPRLTLLEITDFHGSLIQSQRDRATNRPIGGAAALAAWVARERAKNPTRTILLDGGDWMQGTPISNLNFGRPVIGLMNRLGTDASATGNHEFDWSVDTLYARMREARFQPLGANWVMKDGGRRAPDVAPWTILERDGMRIGVIGLLTDGTATVTLPQNVKAYTFPEGGPIARALADSVRAAGADMFVVVGHLPGSSDSTGTVRGELADVARAVSGPDGAIAVLGGHSHNRLSGVVDGTPVLIAGALGTTLGRIDFVIDRAAHRPIPEETRRQLITTFADDPEPDSTIAAFVDSVNARLLPITSRVLGRSRDALTRNRQGESSLGDWVADVMRASVGADFAFQNPGGLRADLDAGDVTMGDVYEVMPFDNQVATVTLTGAQVLDLLEHGVSPTTCVQMSGLSVVYDPERPRGERVLEVRLPGGKRLDPAGRYRVATNDFMAQGGDGFTMIAKGEGLDLPGVLVRDALIADVEKHGKANVPFEAPTPGRIVNRSAKAPTADANR